MRSDALDAPAMSMTTQSLLSAGTIRAFFRGNGANVVRCLRVHAHAFELCTACCGLRSRPLVFHHIEQLA